MNPPTQPTVEDVVRDMTFMRNHTSLDSEQIAAVDRAIALLSALEKDALRYRWLRDARYDYDDWYVTGRDAQGSVTTPLMEAELDTAIDLARGQS